MTDYYAVLKRAVGGLEHEAVDVRRAIYDKARAALLGQLKAITPPLTTAEISRQRLELEEAIRRVEREAAVTAAGPSPARARAAAAAAEAQAAEAVRLPEDDVQPVAREPQAPRPASRATPVPPDFRVPEPRVSEPRVTATEPRFAEAAPSGRPQSRAAGRIAEPVRVEPPPVVEAEEAPRRGRQPMPRREPSFDAEPAAEAAPPLDESEAVVAPVAADEREEWPDASDSETLLVAEEEAPRRARRPRREQKEPVARVEQRGHRRGPILIILLLALLMLVGIAALAWSQRGKVNDVIGDLISTSDKSDTAPPADPSETATASGKNADRLGDVPPEEAPKTVRTVTAEPSPEGTEPDPLAGVMQPDAPAPSAAAPAAEPEAPPMPEPEAAAPEPAATPTPVPTESIAAATPPADEQPATPGDDLVAQKAILYEQPLGGSSNVTALQASVTWKFEPNSTNGPEIVANVDVPDRQMKVTVNIRKNTDTALPASHLVEVIIDTPADFPGGGVKAVPALVMKPTEEARGVPLDGAAAKVADGFFWIAFANDNAPMQQNIALMRERNWIDIPLVYNNDQRAILTLEKGTPGQRVFEKALTAWGN